MFHNLWFIFCIVTLTHDVAAMFAKKQRYYEYKEKNLERRFRANVAELFLDNQVSGDRAMSLFEDATAAGTKYTKDLCNKSVRTTSFRKNASRDLLRRLLKSNKWPAPYIAEIRMWDPKTQEIKYVPCAFLLPHEIMDVLFKHNNKDTLLDVTGMTAACYSHLQKQKIAFKKDSAVAVGLWVDGAPYNWDRSESLEVITMSLPGLANQNGNLRIPLCCFGRKFVAKEHTWDDVFEVLSWSFTWLAVGQHPPRRHDSASFSEKGRTCQANKELLQAGFVCELRGDWKMLNEVVKIPAWNKKNNCSSYTSKKTT